MILFKQVTVYGPEKIGCRDVLVAGEQIVNISEQPIDTGNLEVTVIEGIGKVLVPGFIDAHVHVCGGGGEGGYKTRTPEMAMTEMIRSGVTTVVGCLGTDGIARTMENLIAKTYGLREEGVSAYCYTGSYQVPVRTLTGDIMKDLMMIDPIIGVGEIAINDHRSSSPTVSELVRIASEARVGGVLSGKAGVVNCHLGDGPFDLAQIDEAVTSFVLPITQFYLTHINRNPRLFEKGISHALKGGMVDLTTSTTAQFIEEGEIPAAEGFMKMLLAGVPPERVTLTSDGHGSLPKFNESGEFEGLGIGKLDSLFHTVKSIVLDYGIPLEVALQAVTSTPAKYLKLKGKGQIAIGQDADILLLDQETLTLNTVMARGKLALHNNEMLFRDTIVL